MSNRLEVDKVSGGILDESAPIFVRAVTFAPAAKNTPGEAWFKNSCESLCDQAPGFDMSRGVIKFKNLTGCLIPRKRTIDQNLAGVRSGGSVGRAPLHGGSPARAAS